MDAIILSVGDELVLGQTVDTNCAWLSQQLASIGCGVLAHATVGDDQAAIEAAIAQASRRCQLLLITGGLGPTEDDLTRQALAAAMDAELLVNQDWLGELERFFAARTRRMPPANRIQAMIPRGAKMIFNTAGTAAGIEALLNSSCRVFAMPGVPKEMKIMFARDVLPAIRERTGGAAIVSRTLHTFGLGESAIAEMLGELMQRGRNPSVGTTVANGVVSLRVNARFDSEADARRELDKTVSACRAALGNLIYGQDEQTLQEVVADLLKKNFPDATIATAESCTGGLVAKMLTDISGSSAWFRQGWVTYANEAKQQLLDVPETLLAAHGAVSREVVAAMAESARRKAAATFAIAVSGIAGPGGGSAQKPVGTTWIALAKEIRTETYRFVFPGDREFVRDRAARMALTILRCALLGQPLPFQTQQPAESNRT